VLWKLFYCYAPVIYQLPTVSWYSVECYVGAENLIHSVLTPACVVVGWWNQGVLLSHVISGLGILGTNVVCVWWQVKLCDPSSNTCHTWGTLPSARQHPSYDYCLEVKREYYQNCSVLDSVIVHSQQHTYMSRSYTSNREDFLEYKMQYYRNCSYMIYSLQKIVRC